MSIRKQAEGLAKLCRVTVVVLNRVLPPMARYDTHRALPRAIAALSTGGEAQGEVEPRKAAGQSAAGGAPEAAGNLRVLHYRYPHCPVIWPITEPFFTLVLGLWAYLRHARDADLLHGHTPFSMGVPATLLGKLTGRPSLVTIYGADLYLLVSSGRRLLGWWVRLVLRTATRVVGVSRSLIRIAAELGISKENCRHVPSGVDTDHFAPPADLRALRQQLGLPSEAHIFLCSSLFMPIKGHAIVVEAFHQISASRPDGFLVLTSDGPLLQQIVAQVEAAGLTGRLRFTGLLDYNEMPLWVAAADTLVLPSLDEGMSLSILEALSSGKPVVATAVGGTPELISDERLGLLVPPADANALARALEEAMDRDWDAEILRAEAMSFSWPAVVDQLYAVYEELVCAPRRFPRGPQEVRSTPDKQV